MKFGYFKRNNIPQNSTWLDNQRLNFGYLESSENNFKTSRTRVFFIPCQIIVFSYFFTHFCSGVCMLFFKNLLTEVAGEGGTDCPPQKFLSYQKFRHLMGWRNMQKKIFLSCLVSEIQLFVYIFGRNSKWLPEVWKGWPVKFFEVSYYQNFF